MGKNISKINDRGVTAIVIALLMLVFLGVAALAVDVGYLYMARNQLQNAADAAALAGARQLGYLFKNHINGADAQGTLQEPNITGNPDGVKTVAIATAKANKVTASELETTDIDVKIGRWSFVDKKLTETNDRPRAVQVHTHRQNTHGIGTFFARLLGRDVVDVSAIATATLLPVPSGTPEAPFVIAQDWFTWNCSTPNLIWNVSSNDASCAAWWGQNKNDVKPRIQCVYADNCPVMVAGDSAGPITNGQIANIYYKKNETLTLVALFDYMKTRDDDGNPNTWTTIAPVVNLQCARPSTGTSYPNVVGFATITISIPNPDEQNVYISTNCNVMQDMHGGGSIDGTDLATLPSLVQ